MMSTCDSVAERVALGEPLGELAGHVASCEQCRAITELPALLGATRTPIDPGLGFSARMTAGAQQRITVRRRRRVAAGVIATMAAGVLGVVLVTREPDTTQTAALEVPTLTTPEQPNPPVADDAGEIAELRALLRLADTQRSRRLSAHWTKIQRPLAPYRVLVNGTKDVTP